ncbi:hypothetical protein LTR56_021032 [Elasticomyces elasticus]|nr:hypothetical protein LTR56_021032 [Elasticomyces elasticus]KAK3646934.1 hypothetical protein LTR22_014087 [Elasticomyces elasticus]KAK4909893.1 hypothetical protein LTR49_021378 [Elasticomyces elasticus]KAK5750354.1 hypothetical protein LTS12_019615 [Elasticomyces elasticus]
MASYAISDLYQRYKSGTKKVVQWLAETAGTECIGITSSPQSKTIQLTTANLVQLAKRIVGKASPKREAPKGLDSIIRILVHVIAGRRECSVWYQQKAELAGQKNASHSHFIEVLRTVLQSLQQASEGSLRKKSKAKKKAPVPEENVLNNIFEGLSVEEPSEGSQHVAHPTPRAATPTRPSKVNYELEVHEDDKDFALWCFLEDCHKLRVFVRNTWLSYVDGRLSLPVAAEVTNRAWLLIRIAANRFANSFPDLWTFDHVAQHLDLDLATNGNVLENFQCKGLSKAETPGDTTSRDAVVAADLLCIPAYISFTIIRSWWWASSTSFDHLRELMGYAEAAHPFTYSMMEMQTLSPTLGPIRKAWLKDEGLDMFFTDVLPFADTRKVLPLYSVIDLQICMDIEDIVGYSRGAQLYDVMALATSLDEELAMYESLAPTLLDAHTYPGGAATSPQREIIKRRIDKGIIQSFQRPRRPKPRLEDSVNWRDLPALAPYYLRLPVTCGWFANYVDQPTYLDGIATCNNGHLVLAVAHLYTACRDQGLVKAWKDMDFIIETQGAERLRLWSPGATVRSLETAARRYDMALGVEAAHHTRDRAKRTGASRVHLPSPRKVAELAVRLEPRSALTRATMEIQCKPIDRLTSREDWERDDNAAQREMLRMTERLMERPPADLDEQTRKQWASAKVLTPEQLMALMQGSLSTGEVEQGFQYHLFFKKCAEFLEDTKDLI